MKPPEYVTILYESNHAYRVIPMDGRPHPGKNIKLFMGDSRGRWEGNTLVVDVTNFNDETWFDSHGTIHSDALHVVERWTMAGPDRIDYEVDHRGSEGVCEALENRVRHQPQQDQRRMNSGRMPAPRVSATWSAFWKVASARKTPAEPESTSIVATHRSK